MSAAEKIDSATPGHRATISADMVSLYVRLLAPGTQAVYNAAWCAWCAHCRSEFCRREPMEAEEVHALGFVEAERRRGIRDITIRHKASILHALYRYLQSQGAVKKNIWAHPLRLLRKARVGEFRPSQPLTPEQTAALLDAPDCHTPIGVRDRAVLALLWSGFRVGEVLALTLGDYRSTGAGTRYMHLVKTKSGHDEQRAIPGWCAARVDAWLERRRLAGAVAADLVFVALKGRGPAKRQTSRPVGKGGVELLVRRYAAMAGLPETVTPHWGRCTCVCALRAAGVDPADIQRVTGHASIAMVEYYDRRKKTLEESAALKLSYGLMK